MEGGLGNWEISDCREKTSVSARRGKFTDHHPRRECRKVAGSRSIQHLEFQGSFGPFLVLTQVGLSLLSPKIKPNFLGSWNAKRLGIFFYAAPKQKVYLTASFVK